MTTQLAEPEEPLGGYEWPPTPVLDPDVAAEILAQRLGEAYDDLEAQRLRIITAAALGNRTVTAAWLKDFQTALAAFLTRAPAEVETFLRLHLGPRYEEGASAAAETGDMEWNQAHSTALTSLAIDTYEDFLQRSQEAGRVSEAFARAVRKASADEIPKIAAGGRTARQVGDQLSARLLDQYGVDHVTYRDGAHVPVRAYARMAARTKSAVAYNAGSLNEWHQNEVTHVEVFDGAECGWSSHEDTDLANGTVRPIADAAAHMLGHPNCRRSFGARPDVTTDEEAARAEPSTTAEQRADQAASELAQLSPRDRGRAANLRRARQAALREQRATGATSPEQVGDIINRSLTERGLIAAPSPAPTTTYRNGTDWFDEEYPAELKDAGLLARAQDNVPALQMSRADFEGLDEELIDDLMSEIPVGEERALAGWRAYTGGRYMPMNKTLRNGEEHNAEGFITAMDEFFDSRFGRTMTEPTSVWRGLRTYLDFDPSSVQVGEFVSDPGYLSASASEATGRAFGDWVLDVRMMSGAPWAPGTDYEREVVLPRGSVIEIVGRDEQTKTLIGRVVQR